jgi:hypothetical protein
LERRYLAAYPRDPSNPHAKALGGRFQGRTAAAPLTDGGSGGSGNGSGSGSASGNGNGSSNFGGRAVPWAERLANREADFGTWEVSQKKKCVLKPLSDANARFLSLSTLELGQLHIKQVYSKTKSSTCF